MCIIIHWHVKCKEVNVWVKYSKNWQTFSDWLETRGKGEQMLKKIFNHISVLSGQKIRGPLTGMRKPQGELILRIKTTSFDFGLSGSSMQ